MEAIGIHDYQSTDDEELSFERGDILKVIRKSGDSTWYTAELNGQEGLVPSNYVEIKPTTWFRESASRGDAETHLLDKDNPMPLGAFIVRGSTTVPGEYSISVKLPEGVKHYQIHRVPPGKYRLWDETFSSINQMVEHYKKATVSPLHTVVLKDFTRTQQKQAMAMYDFESRAEEEVGFKRRDIITDYVQVDENWSHGTVNGQTGSFPTAFVKLL